jgi:hypothetical protein
MEFKFGSSKPLFQQSGLKTSLAHTGACGINVECDAWFPWRIFSESDE